MKLYLCEKPSQAKDLARVLGAKVRGEGCIKGDGIIVTWGIGHLLEAAPPDAYNPELKNWTLQALPIIPPKWKMLVKPKTASQYKVVKLLLKEANELVIATDADREGEMIARELVDHCGYRGPIQRAWLSALNDVSIRKALASLKSDSDTYPLYLSALARSRADWLIGMNFTRLFTLIGRQSGYNGVLSVGRVQTPTLRLVVDRDREISSFVVMPFWDVEARLSPNGGDFIAQWIPDKSDADSHSRCLNQQHAIAIQRSLSSATTAVVVAVETERVREAAPLPFDLGTLQEICSRKFGLGAQETLNIAQALYETHKATTYPRTDCGYLPESMLAEVPSVLKAIVATDPMLTQVVKQLDLGLKSRAWNEAKVAAHHGIIPTLEPADLKAMSPKEKAVYELIRTHYLAQFAPHHEYDRTVADLAVEGIQLRAVGKQIVEAGWKLLFVSNEPDGEDAPAKGQILPSLQNGSRCHVDSVQLKAQKTQPPKPYTEGDLIKAMKTVAKLVKDPRLAQKLKDTTGIGTEATRAGIIQGLIDREFLQKKGKAVRATETAFTLIDAVPPAIADPGTTAIWEQALDMIEAGSLSLDDFISKQSMWITKLVHQYKSTTLKLNVPLGPPCPKCNSAMAQRFGKAGMFWACPQYPACNGTAACDATSTAVIKKTRAKKVGANSKVRSAV